MSAIDLAPLGRTHRPEVAVAADAQAAATFWQSLESLDETRRARILGERGVTGPLAAVLAEVAAWNHAYSDRSRRARSPVVESVGAVPDEAKRRAFVDEQTADIMPPPRLWNRNTWVGREQERHERRLWSHRIQSPAPRLLRRLRTEADAIEREVARAGLEARSQFIDPSELRTQRWERLLARRYTPGRINPVGMSYQRALQIAVACLERQERLTGISPRPRRNTGTPETLAALGR
jgi:hypothetical protein